jgi:hypothetical protein
MAVLKSPNENFHGQKQYHCTENDIDQYWMNYQCSSIYPL